MGFWFGRTQAIDSNRDGELSLEEFVDFMLTQFFGSIDEKLAFGFKTIDLDKNGVITKVCGCACVLLFVTNVDLACSRQRLSPWSRRSSMS